MMAETPWFPDYYVEVSDSDSKSFITNSVQLRITTRVPREQLEDVINTLLPNQALPTAMKEVVRGRS
ncbi:hypothetical protein PBI_MA5_42 [Mycobacterium phage MA5]|uniref:Uncharacterized protein n=1 Tax=Mycobacterium phage MA5 TaxID=2725640 RepID=A0A6M3TBG3_9CAUD|nr:hypothetical protein KIP28_gp49 [Mycobacterium phage MA5]QJD52094.1 hypothetical protein PBI_MA5_42 [Mycobacterium phage MA5]